MKKLFVPFLLLLVLGFAACNPKGNEAENKKADSLQQVLDQAKQKAYDDSVAAVAKEQYVMDSIKMAKIADSLKLDSIAKAKAKLVKKVVKPKAPAVIPPEKVKVGQGKNAK